jgi:hypothetical protein
MGIIYESLNSRFIYLQSEIGVNLVQIAYYSLNFPVNLWFKMDFEFWCHFTLPGISSHFINLLIALMYVAQTFLVNVTPDNLSLSISH